MVKAKVPIYISHLLANLSLDEVMFWSSLAKSKFFPEFEKFMYSEAERRKNVIWQLPESDPTKLAIEKAALRGGIETIHGLVSMARGAKEELEKRSDK